MFNKSHKQRDFSFKAEGLRIKLSEMKKQGFVPGRAGRFLETAVETMDSTLKRCTLYPYSPHYDSLVKQLKDVSEMSKLMLTLEGSTNPEFFSILDKAIELHDNYMKEK
jgi:hypothetical protein